MGAPFPVFDDDDVLPIVVDAETRARLWQLAALVRDSPLRVAASLLHDVLREDELFNVPRNLN
jgi:hypothetical protein